MQVKKLATKYVLVVLALLLTLALAGCAGKAPTLGKTQSPRAPELYAQAKDLEENAASAADMQNAAAVYAKAIRAGSPEAACGLARLYLTGAVPVPAGKDESAQEAADKAAFNLLMQAAQSGYAPAQYDMAVMYADERGVKRDMNEARAWLLKSGDSGYGEAQLKLGDAYYESCGCGANCDCGSTCCFGLPKDYAKAEYWYSLLAASDDKDVSDLGRSKLAALYADDDGAKPNYAKAAEQYQAGVDAGDPHAQGELAFMYFRGQGVPRDYEKAVALHEDLLERFGEESYGYNMGVLYYYAPAGKDQKLRQKEAFRLFKAEADRNNNVYARSALGECYEHGVGVARDYAQAAKWYGLAAEQSFADAQFLLGELYRKGLGVKRDYSEALRLFEQAAAQNSAWGQRGAAGMYYRGDGVNRDYARALELYTQAAEGNDQEAMFMLGQMYEQGQGTSKDAAAAREWYTRAADYPASEAHYWDPDTVAQYNGKARAALQRLGQ